MVEKAVASAIHSDVNNQTDALMDAAIYEHNRYSNISAGFTTGWVNHPGEIFGSGAHQNFFYYKNTFAGLGIALQITPKAILRENNYQGFATLYKGGLTGVVEAPYHVVEINVPVKDTVIKTPFTLINSGSAVMVLDRYKQCTMAETIGAGRNYSTRGRK